MVVPDTKYYLKQVTEYYRINKKTTEIQIDTLIFLYKKEGDDRVFALIFKTHQFLLKKLVQSKFDQYRSHLYEEDFYELLSMAYGEFFRRVMFYKMPPVAPFSKYVKLYMKKWLNAYVKLMVTRNNRTILNVDYKNKDGEDEFI